MVYAKCTCLRKQKEKNHPEVEQKVCHLVDLEKILSDNINYCRRKSISPKAIDKAYIPSFKHAASQVYS